MHRNAHQTLRQSHTQTTRGALGLLLSHSSFRSSVPTGSNLDLARSGLSLRGGPSLCFLLNESDGLAHGSRLSRVPVSPFEVVFTDARAAPSAHLGWRNAERPGPPQPPQAQRTPARGNFSILGASRDLPSQCAAARPRRSFWPSLAVRTGSHSAVEAPPESESRSPGTLNRQAGWFQLRVGLTENYSPLIGSESIGRALPVALGAASPTVTVTSARH